MNVFKIAVLPIVVLALSLGSCQKSTEFNNPIKKGGDLDEPIVIGSVRTNQQAPVPYALVEAYPYGSSELDTSVNANSQGNFTLTVGEAGSYYFKAYDGLTLLTTTGDVDVSDTTYYDIVQP